MNKNVRTKSDHLYGYSVHNFPQALPFDLNTAGRLGLEKTILLEYLYRKYSLGSAFEGQVFFGRVWHETSIEFIANALPFFDKATVQRLWDEIVSDGLLHAIPDGSMLYTIDLDALDSLIADSK